MQKLMDQVIQVYEIEQQGQKCQLNSKVVLNLDTMDSGKCASTLLDLRKTIEDSGLEKLNIYALLDDIAF